MKLLILADLHFDLWLRKNSDPFKDVPVGDLLGITHCILAGDLANKAKRNWVFALSWVSERLPGAQIFILPGNHDYYDAEIDNEAKLGAVASEAGAAFLQKSELIFGRQRFLCTTLWTDFEVYGDRVDNLRYASAHLNDYRAIRVSKSGYAKLKPTQTAQIHIDHRAWLEERLAEQFDGETTVVTHHAPHAAALNGTPDYGPCYASDLEQLILKYQPSRWIFGHTHHRVSFKVGRTVLRNVSIGYPGQLEQVSSLKPFTFELEEEE